MKRTGGSVKLWKDERMVRDGKRDKVWVLTVRMGDIVENLRFGSREKALTYKRGLKTRKRVVS